MAEQTREEFTRRVARISPDATLTIQQKCRDCNGSGATDLRARCQQCGHVFTADEMQRESAANDTMLCGCDWRYRHEEDECRECGGSGSEALTVTLQELAVALWHMQPSLAE